MSVVLLPSTMPLTALRNTAVNTCKLDCGSAAVLDNLTTLALMFWISPSSFPDGRVYGQKRVGPTGWILQTSGTTGNLQWFSDRNTTNMNYVTSSTPLAPAGTWKLIALTRDTTAGHIYRGDLLNPATECTYGTSTAGSGSFADDSAQTLLLTGDGNFGLLGDMGPVVVVNRALSLAEIRAWQINPTVLPAGTVGHWWLGAEGTGLVLDRSGNGNHGTITSLLPVAGVAGSTPSRVRTLALAVTPSPSPSVPYLQAVKRAASF